MRPGAKLSCVTWNVLKHFAKNAKWDILVNADSARLLFTQNDILVLTETGLTSQKAQDRNVHGFSHYFQCRDHGNGGGVSIYVRHGLHRFVSVAAAESHPGLEILWLRISGQCTVMRKDILVCGIYFAPDRCVPGATQSMQERCELILNSIANVSRNAEQVIMFGDFNAHIGTLNDVPDDVFNVTVGPFSGDSPDTALATELMEQIGVVNQSAYEHITCLQRANSSIIRPTQRGRYLIDSVCKPAGLIIANGRSPGDAEGACTFPTPKRDCTAAMLDLCIISPSLHPLLTNLSVINRRGTGLGAISDHWPLKAEFCVLNPTATKPRSMRAPHASVGFSPDSILRYGHAFTPGVLAALRELDLPSAADQHTMDERLDKLNTILLGCQHAAADAPARHAHSPAGLPPSHWPVELQQLKVTIENYTDALSAAYRYNAPEHIKAQLGERLRSCRRDFKSQHQEALQRLEAEKMQQHVDLLLQNPRRFFKLLKPKHTSTEAPPIPTLLQHYKALYGMAQELSPSSLDLDKLSKDMGTWHCHAHGTTSSDAASQLLERRRQDASDAGLNDAIHVSHIDVQNVLDKLGNNKACGPDRVASECMKYARVQVASTPRGAPIYEHFLTRILANFFNTIIATGNIPTAWNTSLLTAIYKGKGDTLNPNSYRGIAVACNLAKVFAAVLESKISAYLERFGLRALAQAGFRAHMGTQNNLDALEHFYAKHSHAPEGTKPRDHPPLYVCLIDFVKAFDMVQRQFLWTRLGVLGLQGKVLRTIQHLYERVEMRVKHGKHISEAFRSFLGVKQGDPLSPLLFGAFIETLPEFLHYALRDHPNLLESCPDVEGAALFYMLFADDLILLSTTHEFMQAMLDQVAIFCKRVGMQVNLDKTEIALFGTPAARKRVIDRGLHEFTYNERTIRFVHEFKYLGIWFDTTGKCKTTHTRIVDAASRASFLLKRHLASLSLTPATQLRLFDALIKPILSYGSQVWGVDILQLPGSTTRKGVYLGPGLAPPNNREYSPSNIFEHVQTDFIRFVLGTGKHASVWCTVKDAGCTFFQEHVLRGILRFWNTTTSSSNKFVLNNRRADIRLMATRNPSCWSYRLCVFLADLGRRMDSPIFAEPFQSDLLARTTVLGADHVHYFMNYTMDINRICTLLHEFWVKRVTTVIDPTADPRAPACDHRTLASFVRWVGINTKKRNKSRHLTTVMPRAHFVRLSTLKHDRWPLNGCAFKRKMLERTDNHSPAYLRCNCCTMRAAEDVPHVLFECTRYGDIRADYPELFSHEIVNNYNLIKFFQHDDQAKLAECVSRMHDARFGQTE